MDSPKAETLIVSPCSLDGSSNQEHGGLNQLRELILRMDLSEMSSNKLTPSLVKAIEDYEPSAETGMNLLQLNKGDVIEVLYQPGSGWMHGRVNDKQGWFPSRSSVPIVQVDDKKETLASYNIPYIQDDYDLRYGVLYMDASHETASYVLPFEKVSSPKEDSAPDDEAAKQFCHTPTAFTSQSLPIRPDGQAPFRSQDDPGSLLGNELESLFECLNSLTVVMKKYEDLSSLLETYLEEVAYYLYRLSAWGGFDFANTAMSPSKDKTCMIYFQSLQKAFDRLEEYVFQFIHIQTALMDEAFSNREESKVNATNEALANLIEKVRHEIRHIEFGAVKFAEVCWLQSRSDVRSSLYFAYQFEGSSPCQHNLISVIRDVLNYIQELELRPLLSHSQLSDAEATKLTLLADKVLVYGQDLVSFPPFVRLVERGRSAPDRELRNHIISAQSKNDNIKQILKTISDISDSISQTKHVEDFEILRGHLLNLNKGAQQFVSALLKADSCSSPQFPEASIDTNGYSLGSVLLLDDTVWESNKDQDSQQSPVSERLRSSNSKESLASSFRTSSNTHNRNNSTSASSISGTFSDDQWFVTSDHSKSLILDSTGQGAKGGTFSALMERLTSHDMSDPTFNRAMLLTYRSFAKPAVFFGALVQRFNIQPPEGLSPTSYKQWIQRKQHPIRSRAFNILKMWLERYWFEPSDTSETNALLKSMSLFLTQLIAMNFPKPAPGKTSTPSTELLDVVDRRLKGEEVVGKRSINNSRSRKSFCPPPRPIIDDEKLVDIKLLNIEDISPLELARQLTLRDHSLFIKIKPPECLNKAWTDGANDEAKNVRNLINASNKLSNWVAYEVLSAKDSAKRAERIKAFIKVAEACYRDLNNFSAMMAISSALNSSTVYRLSQSWALVPEKDLQQLSTMNKMMNSARNFNVYRKAIRDVAPPCIPFFGVFLTDLTFTEDGNSDRLRGYESSMINFSKRLRSAEVIDQILQYQTAQYNLQVIDELQAFIDCGLDKPGDIDSLYSLSLTVEPPANPSSKNNTNTTTTTTTTSTKGASVRRS